MNDDQLESLWKRAIRDDACQTIVPSEIRQLINEARRYRLLLAIMERQQVTSEVRPDALAEFDDKAEDAELNRKLRASIKAGQSKGGVSAT